MLTPKYVYRAKLISVHDGDTLWLDVDLGLHTHVHWRFRVKDLWCAELSAPDGSGKAAAAHAEQLLAQVGPDLVIETEKVKTANPDTLDSMSFERFVAVVQLADGRLFADVMIADGFGTATR